MQWLFASFDRKLFKNSRFCACAAKHAKKISRNVIEFQLPYIKLQSDVARRTNAKLYSTKIVVVRRIQKI